MKHTLLGALAVTALLGTATAATACPGGNKGMMSHGSEKGMHSRSGSMSQQHSRKHLVQKVIAAVSKTGLSAKQAAAVTDAVNAFKMRQMELKGNKTMPIDAFGDEAFDAAYFKKTMQKKFDAKIDAKVELFQSVYAILNADQRKVFKREFTAPMVSRMIRKNMVKGHMMPGKGGGKGCRKGN
ncbi:MAG: hypothetical protein P8Y65_03045 [Campylobacterales bacterium]